MFCTEYNVKDTLAYVGVYNIRDEEEINTLSIRERMSFILIYMHRNVNFISPLSWILSAKNWREKHRTPIRRTCNFNAYCVHKRHINLLWDVKIYQRSDVVKGVKLLLLSRYQGAVTKWSKLRQLQNVWEFRTRELSQGSCNRGSVLSFPVLCDANFQ
jgi:hypothetical protein